MLQRALLGPDSLDEYMESLGEVEEALLTYATELVDQEAAKCGVRSPPLPGSMGTSQAEGGDGTTSSVVMERQLAGGVMMGGGGGVAGGSASGGGDGGGGAGGGSSPLLEVLTIVRNRISIQQQARAATASARRRGQS